MAGTDRAGLSPARAVALAAVVGAAATAVSLLPLTEVAYRSPALHVAIETAATLIALLCGTLLIGRFLRTRSLPELVLAASLVLLGATNLSFAVIPWIADSEPGSFDTWAPIGGRLLGAVGLMVGALLPAREVHRPRRAALAALAAVGAAVLAIGVAATLLASSLPTGIDPQLPPNPTGPDLVGEPAVLVTQVLAFVLYAGAALGLLRRAEATGDELMAWFAAGVTLAAFSRLNYFLYPSLYSEWVYAGDFLRLAFYAVILGGALREIAGYQHQLAEIAVLRERRRIARELHDGLAQELVFIKSQARRLDLNEGSPAMRIGDAADRALDESRHAIVTLARPIDATLDSSVAQAAEDVAGREGIDLELDLAPGLRANDSVHEAFMRIVREAVANAVRHGGATSVAVRLEQADGLRLTVDDDGAGINGAASGPGFGLVSMRERASALGGEVRVLDRERGGVRIEVRVP
jgi:signal transduction histidine kinase